MLFELLDFILVSATSTSRCSDHTDRVHFAVDNTFSSSAKLSVVIEAKFQFVEIAFAQLRRPASRRRRSASVVPERENQQQKWFSHTLGDQGGTGDTLLSDPSPSSLPGMIESTESMEALTGIALGIIEIHKPPHHVQGEYHGGEV